MTVINIVHEFNQAAKMGYSNAAHTGTDKGYVNDWRNKFPGYEHVRGFASNYDDQYFFPDEQGATPYWWAMENINRTFGYRGGGGDGWQGCRDYILKMYTDGKLTAYTAQCAVPTVTVSTGANSATVTVSGAQSGATVHYTTDGSIPTAASPVYSGPIAVYSSRIVRVQTRIPGAYPSRIILKAVVVATGNETNVAPQGTAFSWNNDYQTADRSNSNRIALVGLNDANSTTDVRLSQTPGTPYADGDPPYRYATWQGGGVVWNTTVSNITRFEYVQGTVTNEWWGGHGCYFWNVKLELSFDGTTWVDAGNWGCFKEFPFASFYGPATGAYAFPATQVVPSRYDPVVFFLAQPTAIRGFRIMGGFNIKTGYDQPDYINVRELRAFQNNTISTGVQPKPNDAVKWQNAPVRRMIDNRGCAVSVTANTGNRQVRTDIRGCAYRAKVFSTK